jgi:hypothetical protein
VGPSLTRGLQAAAAAGSLHQLVHGDDCMTAAATTALLPHFPTDISLLHSPSPSRHHQLSSTSSSLPTLRAPTMSESLALRNLLTRLEAKMETMKRHTWFELQRSHYYPPLTVSITTPQQLNSALQHFHIHCSEHELRLLFAAFPDSDGAGFSFTKLSNRLFPMQNGTAAAATRFTRGEKKADAAASSANTATLSPSLAAAVEKKPESSSKRIRSQRVRPGVAASTLYSAAASHRRRFVKRETAIGRVYTEREFPSCAAETLRADYEKRLNAGDWTRV